MEIKIAPQQDLVKHIKDLLKLAHANKSLGQIQQFQTEFPTLRFIISPHRMTGMSIMGKLSGLQDVGATERGKVIETGHTFEGTGFFFDQEGYLSLTAGDHPAAPWLRLAFNQADEPSFELTVLLP